MVGLTELPIRYSFSLARRRSSATVPQHSRDGVIFAYVLSTGSCIWSQGEIAVSKEATCSTAVAANLPKSLC